MLRGESVNENCGEEPVCLISSGGLVDVNSKSSSFCVEGRARPSVLRGEPVNCGEEPVCVKCSEGLVNVGSKSSSFCVEGRARQ